MTLIFLCLGWLAGLCLGLMAEASGGDAGDAVAVPLVGGWPALGGLIALAAVAGLLAGDDRRLRVTAISVAAGLLGLARIFVPQSEYELLAAPVGESIALHGTVAGRPEVRDSYLLLVLDVHQVRGESSLQPVRARVLVRTDRFQEWDYGDRVVAWGRLRPVDEGSYWSDYLARQGIRVTLEYPTLRREAGSPEPDLRRAIDGLRDRLEQLCGTLLPEPQASLLSGILVGARSSMPVEFRDALNATGTSHLVAVSGFNVTVVAGIAQAAALRILSRRRATLLAIAAVWFYSLLTGLPPSAFRAAIMATMGLLAILVGRGGDALSFLLFSGAVMAGLDPLLLYDLGFQLSFLATAGLVLLEPVLRAWLHRFPGWLASSLSVTLAAQLATLPVLVTSFHTLSPVSPLSNLLIAPMLPGLMVAGALAVGLGALSEPVGQLLAPLAWLYLTYLVEVVRWTARLPGASLATGTLVFGGVVSYYLSLLLLALWPMPEARAARDLVARTVARVPRWVPAGAVAAILSLGLLTFSGRPDGRLHLYFFDVGDGEATLIRTGTGNTLLVDGGPSPQALLESLGRHQGFLDRSLDALVLTGYGNDRLPGMLEVARRHPIGVVLQPGSPPEKGAGRAWAELLKERSLPTVRAQVGDRIPLGDDSWLEVLWAPSGGDDVGGGMALKLVAGGVELLLLGDLPPAAQAEIARGTSARVALLRVLGRATLDEGLVQAASPRVAVVSTRTDVRLSSPSEGTWEMLRNALVLRTDRHGTIEMVIGRDGYELLTDR